MTDEGVAPKTVPVPGPRYNEQNEADFRRIVDSFMQEVHEGILRVIAQANDDDGNISVGMQLIEAQTLSSVASADFSTSIDDTYAEYIFVITHLIPATDSVTLYMRTSTDGGSTYDTGASDYHYAIQALTVGSTVTQFTSSGATFLALSSTVGSAANEYGWSGRVHLVDPSVAVYTTANYQGSYTNTAGSLTTVDGAGQRISAADVDAVQFLFSSGNIESGEIRLYGVEKS